MCGAEVEYHYNKGWGDGSVGWPKHLHPCQLLLAYRGRRADDPERPRHAAHVWHRACGSSPPRLLLLSLRYLPFGACSARYRAGYGDDNDGWAERQWD